MDVGALDGAGFVSQMDPDDWATRLSSIQALIGEPKYSWTLHYEDCQNVRGGPCNCPLTAVFTARRHVASVGADLSFEIHSLH